MPFDPHTMYSKSDLQGSNNRRSNMAPMASSSALHAALSNDSSLSNDSLSENSSSLDHEVRLLSNARNSNKMSNTTSSKEDADRDMTEDEVAVMVKNALRKARRAMNNSSPVSDNDDDDGGGRGGGKMMMDADDAFADSKDETDDDDSGKFPRFGDARLDSLTPTGSADDMEGPSRSRVLTGDTAASGHSGGGAGDRDDDDGGGGGSDLAKRIEEEIQSARDQALKKYHSAAPRGGSEENNNDGRGSANGTPRSSPAKGGGMSPSARGGGSPMSSAYGGHEGGESSFPPQGSSPVGRTRSARSTRSADTEMTPVISNSKSPNGASGGGGSGAATREHMARSKDKIAQANEQLMKKKAQYAAAVGGGGEGGASSSPGHHQKLPSQMPPSGPASPASPEGGVSPRGARGAFDPNAMSPDGIKDFDALLSVSPTNTVPSTVTAASPNNNNNNAADNAGADVEYSVSAQSHGVMASGDSPLDASMGSAGASPKEGDNRNPGFPRNAMAAQQDGSILTPDSHILNAAVGSGGGGGSGAFSPSNKPPLSAGTPTHSNTTLQMQHHPPPPPPNTNSNKPQQHRQVLFRHPYPLPPPPPLPRSDNIIISSHSAPDKNVNSKWVAPDDDLAALIEAAGEEHNLVRRSNACGALKVLAFKDSNKSKLCRTRGLLDVLVKASWEDAVDSDALDARTRAVTTLLYLSEPKDNRRIVAKHDRLLEVLVKVIEEDTGEARWRASSALATLAKTPGNRGCMGRVDGLATVLADLMVVGMHHKETAQSKDQAKKDRKKDGGGGKGRAGSSANESREDHSTIQGEDSMTRGPSFDTMDGEQMITHTYTGTFTEGTGTTFTEDDMTYQSAYDSDHHTDEEGDEEDGDGSNSGDDDEERSRGTNDMGYGTDGEESFQEEEGVEMQISSLKKLNIENASDFLAKSQLSACATLTHLTKHCANAPLLCQKKSLIDNIVFLAGTFESPLHTRCIEMLCNFTRFPSNNARLASMPRCIETLLHCGKSKIPEDRMWSVRTVQNMCSDAGSKVGLATGAILSLLSTAAMRKDYEEQYAAVGALMNLSTEPGSIVPLTNTKTVVATLVHLAHSPNTPPAVRKIACDSLATIGLWLQTLASAGTVPEEIPFSPLPTHSATGWLRWDN